MYKLTNIDTGEQTDYGLEAATVKALSIMLSNKLDSYSFTTESNGKKSSILSPHRLNKLLKNVLCMRVYEKPISILSKYYATFWHSGVKFLIEINDPDILEPLEIYGVKLHK